MYINISSDQIHIINGNNNYQIDSKNIHKILPVQLVKLFKSFPCKKVFLVNGPGSFTNLRSGCLSLNLLSIFFPSSFVKYSISKIDLYKHFYKLGFLPRFGLIYIGQKKKVWLYDFENYNFDYLEIDKIKDLQIEYFCDQLFGDFKSICSATKQTSISIDEENLILTYGNSTLTKKLDFIFTNQVDNFIPNYMIQPNIY